MRWPNSPRDRFEGDQSFWGFGFVLGSHFSVFAEGAQNSPHIILSTFGVVLLLVTSARTASGAALDMRPISF
jgi:hypothetical protein